MLKKLLLERNNFLKKRHILNIHLTNITTKLKNTENQIRKLCQHEWVVDYIDHKYGEGSNIIEYCRICELSK